MIRNPRTVDKERTKEDKLADYMETKLETLYKEAIESSSDRA